MQILNRSNKWVLISILRFCTILIIVSQLNFDITAKILMGGSLFLLATLAGGIAQGLSILFASLGIVTIIQIVVQKIFLGSTLSLSIHSMFIFLVALVMVALAKSRLSVVGLEIRSALFEFLSVSLSAFLFRQLKVSGGISHLTLLQPEDNIPWISRAKELLTSNEIAGSVSDGGGHSFSHVLALVTHLKNIGISPSDKFIPSLETVVIAYQLLGILGLLFIGCCTLTLMQKFGLSGMIGALCTQIIAFKLLHPLIASEGHLTLLMAITLGWLYLYLSCHKLTDSSIFNLVISISAASLIAGSWWPLAPVSVFLFGFLIYHFFETRFLNSLLIRIFFVTIGVSLLAFSLFAIYASRLSTLDFRGFLLAGGGFTESQPLMTGAAIFGLYALHYGLQLNNEHEENIAIIAFPTVLLAYGYVLSQATYFVGPNFTYSNYSAGKLLYAGVAISLPLIIPAISLSHKMNVDKNVGIVSVVLLILVSTVFFGNNILNGRMNTNEPIWAAAFIKESQLSPNAIIVCNSDNDIAAYQCTKTARYIMSPSDAGGFQYLWEQFQISPSTGTSLIDALEITLGKNSKSEIVVISLEPELTVQDIDRDQLERLPWSRFRIMDAQSGRSIPFPNNSIP